ncbi:MAG: hypothetical protein ACOY16_06820 [Chloroflexota bacterium]
MFDLAVVPNMRFDADSFASLRSMPLGGLTTTWKIYVRSTVIVFFAAFVLLGFSRPPLLLFGGVDLLGAIWTGLALRSLKTA